ncbi:MAG: hypothetical protein AMXMBFR13_04600 [Phycisphaerae bacterium]|jgi:hypothetical protein
MKSMKWMGLAVLTTGMMFQMLGGCGLFGGPIGLALSGLSALLFLQQQSGQ